MTAYLGKAPHPDVAIEKVYEYFEGYLPRNSGLKKFLVSLKRSGRGSENWRFLYKIYFLITKKYSREKILVILSSQFTPRGEYNPQFENREEDSVEYQEPSHDHYVTIARNAPNTCSNCSTVNPRGAEICMNCGSDFMTS